MDVGVARDLPDPELPTGGRSVHHRGPFAAAAQELVRVFARREVADPRAQARVLGHFDGPEGRSLAGRVGVEDEYHLFGESLEQPDLVLGQRRPRAGDRVVDSELVGDDDVELAFHQHRLAAFLDPLAGEVKREEHASFYICGRLR